jgi:hypothetical protein
MTPADVVAHLSRFRFHPATEADLQRALHEVMTPIDAFPHDVTREHRLGPRDRVDLMVWLDAAHTRGIGIEVKVKGTTVALARQVMRYAEHPAIVGVVVVTTRHMHDCLPDTLNGKPVAVYVLPNGIV